MKKRLSPNNESNLIDTVCLVACILCTILVVVDIVRLHFTPVTIILDILILVIDVSYIVRFIKRRRS